MVLDPLAGGRAASGTFRAEGTPRGRDVAAREFDDQVRDALRHLYDSVYLRSHPLTRWVSAALPDDVAAALQQSLLQAIAAVQPAPRSDAARPERDARAERARRRHRLLVLRYVDGHDVQAVCMQLAISRRQFEREHRDGLDAVVTALRERWRIGATDGPAIVPLRAAPAAGRLPVPLTTFVGRERELADVARLLLRATPTADSHGAGAPRRPRLITLTGPAGVGKTRLALELARRVGAAFAGGAILVSLAPIGEPKLVLAAIARALGVRETSVGSLIEGVNARLAGETLLVLDNFEHLLPAAPLVGELLAATERITVIATSRAALRLTGEQEYPVPPLALAPPADERLQGTPPRSDSPGAVDRTGDSEAVRLFVERARAIVPRFALTVETTATVAAICRRLDGLPLAIELAAARVRSLSLPALLARLEAAPGGLALLAGGPRDAPVRHRTLEEAIAWSHAFLDDAERDLFRRLAVFCGGWTLEAAGFVSAKVDVLEALDGLIAKSLVQREPDVANEARFTLLETIRVYALSHLDASPEADEIRRRHAAYYVALATTPESEQTLPWFDAVEREQENLRAAMRWCMTHPNRDFAESGLLIGVALAHLWEFRGHWSQGRDELDWLLAWPPPGDPSEDYVWARATVLTKAGHLAWRQGDYTAARRWYEAGLELRRDTRQWPMIAFSLNSLGVVAHEQGDYAAARSCHEEARALRQQRGHRHLAITLTNLGSVMQEQGEDGAARGLHEEALALARRYSVTHVLVVVLNDAGRLAWRSGDLAAAQAYHEEALAVARTLGDRRQTAAALDHLGRVALSRGDTAGAAQLHSEALAIAWEFGDRLRIAWCLEGRAEVATEVGEYEEAARLFGAARALRDEIGAPLPPTQRASYDRRLAAVRAGLRTTFAAAWNRGLATPLGGAVAAARAIAVQR